MSAGPNPAGPNPLGQDSLGPIAVDVDAPDPALLARVGEILRGGGVVAHPSDTIFGLAAAAHSAAGLARLRALKGRSEDRPFIVLIDEPARVEGLTHSTPRYVIPWISRIWPAPLTLILKARPDAPGRAPDGSVALRCPAQALTRGMVREVAGVMASTSANRAGEPPALNATQALEVFGLRPDGVDLILADAGADPAAPAGLPSTIIDCRGAEPRVIRVGAVSLDRLGIAAS
jgi:tRNA threonylcarbamoyl adenosine modification protein (Sua5/YciO/YrdC/YwlC family)